MNAGFVQELIQMESFVGNSRTVLYKNHIVKIQRKQVLLAFTKDVMPGRCGSICSNGQSCLPSCNIEMLWKVEAATSQQIMCLGKLKIY